MHCTKESAKNLSKEISDFSKDFPDVEVLLCPPFPYLQLVKETINDTDVKLGSQNMHYETSGAFTGEVSPLMVCDIGCEYVILGHSERREIFKEDNELINKKVKTALSHNLSPILCVGETLLQREKNETIDVIKTQVVEGLKDIAEKEAKSLVIAYEPIWAIGTGKTATKEDANEVHLEIRNMIKELFSHDFSDNIRILYGGSVKPGNVSELMAMENIDGALVGGASLKSEDFSKIIDFKNK